MPTIMIVQMIGSLIFAGLCLAVLISKKDPK